MKATKVKMMKVMGWPLRMRAEESTMFAVYSGGYALLLRGLLDGRKGIDSSGEGDRRDGWVDGEGSGYVVRACVYMSRL